MLVEICSFFTLAGRNAYRDVPALLQESERRIEDEPEHQGRRTERASQDRRHFQSPGTRFKNGSTPRHLSLRTPFNEGNVVEQKKSQSKFSGLGFSFYRFCITPLPIPVSFSSCRIDAPFFLKSANVFSCSALVSPKNSIILVVLVMSYSIANT